MFNKRSNSLLFLMFVCLPLISGAADPDFAFGVLADVQYCDCNTRGNRFYRYSIEKLSKAVSVFNQQSLEFVVQLGDLIEKDWQSFDRTLNISSRLRMPIFHVLGNHDFSIPKERIPHLYKKFDLNKGYTAFTKQSWRFVILNGNDLSFHANPNTSHQYKKTEELFNKVSMLNKPNAHNWNGGIGQKQLEWLKKQLKSASDQNQNVILFCHFPVYPAGAHNLWNDQEVIGMIEPFDCVKVFMNGHNHAGEYAQKNGIHYITVPGIVETKDENAFAVARVFKGKLVIDGYGRVRDYVLKFR